MSITEILSKPAFDVEAQHVECPLKMTFLFHPDIFELTIGLWGSTKLNKS